MRRSKFFKPIVEVLEDRWMPVVRTVNSVLDTAGGGLPGQLRREIADAAANDTILIDLPNWGSVIRLLEGPLDSSKNLTIIGNRNPIISGLDKDNNGRQAITFFNATAAVSATIIGVTFTGCTDPDQAGGAVGIRGDLTLQSCSFIGNVGLVGGAVRVVPYPATSATVNITGCTFEGNRAVEGGAISIGPGRDLQPAGATVTINSSVFRNNRAIYRELDESYDWIMAGSGGAISDNGPLDVLNVVDSQFDGNRADLAGGGIHTLAKTFQVIATAGSYSEFVGNRAGTVGGAVYCSANSSEVTSATMMGVSFTGNIAANGGGAYVAFDNRPAQTTTLITACLFNNNQALGFGFAGSGSGGGLDLIHNNGLAAPYGTIYTAITNSTFFDNYAAADGGGLAVSNTASGGTTTVNLTSLTVTKNRVGRDAGGMYVSTGVGATKPTIRNSILAENKAVRTGNDILGDVTSQGFNLVGISNGSTGWNGVGLVPDQFGTLAAPKLAGLANLDENGGPTDTLAVPNTSLAYQTGDLTLQVAGAPLMYDQRGLVRNGTVDDEPVVTVGAFDPDAAGGDAPNNPPVGANNTVTTPEDTAYSFTVNDFNFSDPNDSPSHNFRGVMLTSLPGYGELYLNGTRLTLIGPGIFVSRANIAAGGLVFLPRGGNGASYASFNFKVIDDGGTADGGANTDSTARTMTIDVDGVNDAPEGTDNTVTTLKNAPFTFTAASFGLTDPGDTSANSLANVKITSLPGSGTLTKNGSAVSANDLISLTELNNHWLVFTPAANATGTPHASFTFQVQDNGGTSSGGVDLDPTANTMKINVMDTTFVNDAPVGTATTVTTLQNTAHAFTAANFGFTDPSDSPANAFLAVQITTLPTGGTLKDNGRTLSAGDFVSVSHRTAGLLVYTPNTNSGGAAYDSFTFKVRDDGGTDSSGVNTDATARTMTIDVTLVNQPPVGADNTVTTYQNVPYSFATSDFSFDDPNSSPEDDLYAVKITSLPMFGTLTNDGSAVNAGDSISASAIANGDLVFTPETNFFGSPYDAFSFCVQDDGGASGGGVDLDPTARRMTINVTWVNLAPEGANNTVATNEDTPYALKAIDFGFSDPDELFPNWFDAVKITSLPGAGSLTLDDGAVSTNQFIDIDDILDGLLVFTPAANASGTGYASFGFKVQDDGGTADGGVDLDTTARTLTINVTAVNDAPVNALPSTQSTSEETSLVLSTANSNALSIADVDAGSSTMQVTLSTAQGTLTLSGTTGLSFSFADANGTAAGDGTTDATMTFRGSASAINAALDGLTFIPAVNFDSSASIQVQTRDLGNSGSGGSKSDIDSLTITVNGVNDAPVASVPAPQDTGVNTHLVFSSANSNTITISDVDAHPYEMWIYLSVQHGTLTLGSTSGLTFTLGDGSGDTTVAFYGTLANINAALSGLTFIPTTDYEGEDELYVQIDDQGAYGTGTNLYDIETVAITIGR